MSFFISSSMSTLENLGSIRLCESTSVDISLAYTTIYSHAAVNILKVSKYILVILIKIINIITYSFS